MRRSTRRSPPQTPALAAIRRATDPQAKLEAAGKLVDGAAGTLRTRLPASATPRRLRIYEEESLSLAQLANRVGISKARADQVITGRTKP